MPNNQNVDERIVEMQIDNKKFESGATKTINLLDKLEKALNIKGSTDAFDSINAAVERFNPNPIINGLDKIINAGGVAGTMVKRAVENLTDGLYGSITRITKEMTVGQVKAGFDKYEKMLEATQAIVAATREKVGIDLQEGWFTDENGYIRDATNHIQGFIDQASQMNHVNELLDKMLAFTDETSYNFTDMAANVGKFMAAGTDLDDTFTAIMGVATWGASAGAKPEEVSRSLYNISQAMGSGQMMAVDWKSIENAGMATADFKRHVLEVAAEMGVLTEVMHGEDEESRAFMANLDKSRLDEKGFIDSMTDSEIDKLITVEKFRDSLSGKWFTKDVMMQVFQQYGAFSDMLLDVREQTGLEGTEILQLLDSYREASEAGNNVDWEAYAKGTGKSAEELREMITALDDLGIEYSEVGFRMGQEAKTFSDAMDATRDAVSSKWMKTFQYIFGDYLHSKELWTGVTEVLYNIFASGGDIRNEILKFWNQVDDAGRTGRDYLFAKTKDFQGAFWDLLDAINSVVEPITSAFAEVFGLNFDDAESTGYAIRDLTKRFKEFTEQLGFSEQAQQGLKNIFGVLFTVIKMVGQVIGAVIPIASTFAMVIGSIIDAFIGLTMGSIDITEFCKRVSESFKSILPSADNLKAGIKGLGKFFLDMLPNEEQIVGFFKNIGVVIQNAWKSIKDFFKNNTLATLLPTSEKINAFLDRVANFLDEKYPSLANWVRSIQESGVINNILDSLTKKLQGSSKGISDFFSRFTFNNEEFQKKFKAFSDFATKILTALFGDPKELKVKIDTFIKTLWQSINEAASKLTFRDVLKAVRLAGFTSFVASVVGAVNQFKKAEKALTGIPESISEIFGNMAQGVKDISKGISASFKSNAFLKIAAAIGVIALALYGLSTLDENKLMLAAAVILLIMLVLRRIVDGLNAKDLIDLNKNFQQEGKALVNIRDSTFKLMSDFASILIGLGVLVAAIGYGVSSISKAGETGNVVQASIILGVIFVAIIGAVVGLSFLFRRLTQGNDSLITKKQSEQLAIMLAAAGAALLLIGNAIKAIAKAIALLATAQSLGGDIVTAGLVLGGFAVAMLGLLIAIVAVVNAVATSKTDPDYIKQYGQTILRIASALIIIVAAISALIYPIAALAGIIKLMNGANELWMAAGILGAVLGALVLVMEVLMLTLNGISKKGGNIDTLGQTLLKISGSMAIISIALIMLSGPIMEIATLASLGAKVWQALAIVVIMMALLGGLTWALVNSITDLDPAKIDSIGTTMLKIGGMMLMIAAAMRIISGAILTLGLALVSPEIMQGVINSTIILGVFISALMLVAAFASKIDTKGGIIKVAAAMLIMAVALWIFMPAVLSFVGVTALLAATVKDMDKFGETVGKLALLGVALIAFAVGCVILSAAAIGLGLGMILLSSGALILVVAIEGLTRVIPPFIDMLLSLGEKFEDIPLWKIIVGAGLLVIITALVVELVAHLARLVKEMKAVKAQSDPTVNLQKNLNSGLTKLAAGIKTKVVDIIASVGKTLVENFPTIMRVIGGLLVLTGLYLMGFIPTAVNLIGRAIVILFESLYQVMSQNKGVLEHAIFGIVATVLEIAADAINWAMGILIPYVVKSFTDGIAMLIRSSGIPGAEKLADSMSNWAATAFDADKLRENFEKQSASNHEWFTALIPEATEWKDFVADDTAPALLSGLTDAKNSALTQVQNDAGELVDSLKSNEMIGQYTGAGETMGSTTSGAYESYMSEAMPVAGNNTVIGLVNSLASPENAALLTGGGEGMGKLVANGFTSYAQINSPSRLFARLGEYIPQGLAMGLDSGAGEAIESVVGIGDLMYAAVEAIMAKVGVIADEDFDISPRITPVVDMSNVDSASGYMNGAFGQNYSVSAQMSSSLNRRMADVERAASDMNSRGDQIYNGDVVTVNVYPSPGQDPEEIADAVISRINNRSMRRGVAFG